MPQKETAVPLAYFITFTCYGTWLHGAKTTSVDRHHNIPQTAFLPENTACHASAKYRMIETPYLLNQTKRNIVLTTIKDVCIHYAWVLLATHIRTNHVHIVIHAIAPPEKIMNTIKAYASRRLKESELNDERSKRWTRHGSTKYLWKEEEVEAAIHYVVHEQGKAMAVFENKNRSRYAGAVIDL